MDSQLPDVDNILSEDEKATLKLLLGKIQVGKVSTSKSLAAFRKDYMKYAESFASEKYIKSIDLSLRYLTECLGDQKNISDISVSDILDVLKFLREKAPKGYFVYCRNLTAVFNWGVKLDYLKVNNFDKVKLPKKQKDLPTYISKDQLNKIVSQTTDEIYKTIFQFGFYTGCRRGEIMNLRWNSIKFVDKCIIVGEDFTTKNRKQRTIEMCDTLYNILLKFSKSRQKSVKANGYVFAKSNGFKFDEGTPSKVFKRLCKVLKWDSRIHFHSLRHSFASYLVQKKRSLYEIKELMGHSSIRTTEIYAHLDPDTLKETVSVFDD